MSQSFLSPELWEGKIFNGEWVNSNGGTIDVIEPATGNAIAAAGVGNALDVEEACKQAHIAQKEWASKLGVERAAVLRKAAALLEENTPEIGEWLCRETGSIMPKVFFEIELGRLDLLEAANLCTQPLGQVLAPGEPDQKNLAYRVPLGVIAAITPWNSPLVLATRAIGPALALGNSVVLKPDEQTPITGGIAIARIFEEAGLPKGVLQVLVGGPETGKALVNNKHIAKVSFTGSTEVGREIAVQTASSFKKLSLEMGGNNAIIILDDADMEAACSAASFGAFFHQGQICFTAGRHLVHKNVAEEYIKIMTEKASNLPIGNPNKEEVAIGPMINMTQLERVDKIIKDTVEAGATLLAGGTYTDLYYKPTVLRDVTPDMPAFYQEIFGPVAPITIIESDEEAIELANKTEYGLVASIQTGNLGRGLKIAEALNTGIVHINDQTIVHYATSPIGGAGISGNGSRLGAVSNLDEFTQWKWITYRDQPKAYPF